MQNIMFNSIITCPHCDFHKEETMPDNSCRIQYECKNCHALLKPKPGDCCVYCSYGSVECPPKQKEHLEKGNKKEQTAVADAKGKKSKIKNNLPLLLSSTILLIMLILQYGFKLSISPEINFIIYAIAYLLAGYNTLKKAGINLIKGNIFNEFSLMSIATLG